MATKKTTKKQTKVEKRYLTKEEAKFFNDCFFKAQAKALELYNKELQPQAKKFVKTVIDDMEKTQRKLAWGYATNFKY